MKQQLTLVLTVSAAGKTHLIHFDHTKYIDIHDQSDIDDLGLYCKINRQTRGSFEHKAEIVCQTILQNVNNISHKYILDNVDWLDQLTPNLLHSYSNFGISILVVIPDLKYIQVINKRFYERNVHMCGGVEKYKGDIVCFNAQLFTHLCHFAKENNIEIIYLNEQCPYLENALDLYERKHGLK